MYANLISKRMSLRDNYCLISIDEYITSPINKFHYESKTPGERSINTL